MDSTIITYFAFFIAVAIIIWATLEFRSRLSRMRDREEQRRDTWIRLDPKKTPPLTDEPLIPAEVEQEDQADEQSDQSLHTRARQNGHHTGTKYPL